MSTESRLREELQQERRELTDAVGLLREDLGEVARRTKKIPVAVGGVVALSVVVKAVARAIGKRR